MPVKHLLFLFFVVFLASAAFGMPVKSHSAWIKKTLTKLNASCIVTQDFVALLKKNNDAKVVSINLYEDIKNLVKTATAEELVAAAKVPDKAKILSPPIFAGIVGEGNGLVIVEQKGQVVRVRIGTASKNLIKIANAKCAVFEK